MRDNDGWYWILVIVLVIVCIILSFMAQKRVDELKAECDSGSNTACIEYDNALRRLTEQPVRR